MFYRGNSMLEQSSGRIIRRDQIEHTVRVLAEMEAVLSARGKQINPCFSPEFGNHLSDKIQGCTVLGPGRQTEYDLLLSLLRDRNITAVDLRARSYVQRAFTATLLYQHRYALECEGRRCRLQCDRGCG